MLPSLLAQNPRAVQPPADLDDVGAEAVEDDVSHGSDLSAAARRAGIRGEQNQAVCPSAHRGERAALHDVGAADGILHHVPGHLRARRFDTRPDCHARRPRSRRRETGTPIAGRRRSGSMNRTNAKEPTHAWRSVGPGAGVAGVAPPGEIRDARPSSRRARAWPPALPGSPARAACTSSHAFAAPCRSCLPNARTIPTLSSVFVCFGSICERLVELRQRAIRLIQVVVADAEIGADVGVRRIERQRRLVPPRRLLVLLGVEVQVAQLDARRRVASARPTHDGRGLHLGRVERGVRELAHVAAGVAAAGADAAIAAAARARSCAATR